MEDSSSANEHVPKFPLLSSIKARTSHMRDEQQEKIAAFQSGRERELIHSRHLEENVVSPAFKFEARNTASYWAKKHGVNVDNITKRVDRFTSPRRRGVGRPYPEQSGVNTIRREKTRGSNSSTCNMKIDCEIQNDNGNKDIVIEDSDNDSSDAEDSNQQWVDCNDNAGDHATCQDQYNAVTDTFHCLVLNCEAVFSNAEALLLHEENFEHSPNNPLIHNINCDVGVVQGYICTQCDVFFKERKEYIEHRRHCGEGYDMSTCPVMGFLCGECLAIFQSRLDASKHMTTLKHTGLAMTFKDDITMDNPGTELHTPYPVTQSFVVKWKSLCEGMGFSITCTDCELCLPDYEHLQRHRRDTQNEHIFMVTTSSVRTSCLDYFLSLNKCKSCETLTQAETHECSSGIQSPTEDIFSCKSFRDFIKCCCVFCELETGRILLCNKSNQSLPNSKVPKHDEAMETRVGNCDRRGKDTSECDMLEIEQLTLDRCKPTVIPKKPLKSEIHVLDDFCEIVEEERNSAVSHDHENDVEIISVHQSNTTEKSKFSDNLFVQGDMFKSQHCSTNLPNPGTHNMPSVSYTSSGFTQNLDMEYIISKEHLSTMSSILFLDLDNWRNFFQKLNAPLKGSVFVWAFYGGNTNWTEPKRCYAFDKQKRENRFYIHHSCGRQKDAADFAICLTVGRQDILLPQNIGFIILSGDKGFHEIENQLKDCKRSLVVIDPHHAYKDGQDMIGALIHSVIDM